MTLSHMRSLWWLISGFVIWSVAFIVLYALQALGCAFGWQQHRVILLSAGMICMIPLIILSLRRPQTPGEPASSLAIAGLWANRAALAAGVLVLVAPMSFVTLCT